MRYIKYQLISILLIMLNTSYCQNLDEKKNTTQKEFKNELGFQTAIQLTQIQDLVFSEMIYKGQSLSSIGIFYQRNSNKAVHSFRINYDNISVESTDLISFPFGNNTINRKPSKATYLNIQYRFGRKIWSNNKTYLFTGGLISAKAQYMHYNFGISDDDGFIGAYSLGLWIKAKHKVSDKKSFSIESSLPIANYIIRPQYAIVDNEQIQTDNDFAYLHKTAKLKSLNSLLNFNLRVNYHYQLAPKTELLISYQFEYLKYSDPQRIAILKNGINVGLNFKF